MKTRTAALHLILLTSVALGASRTTDAEWRQFRGPRRDGLSPEQDLLKKWPDDGPRLLWTAEGCGEGFASVTVYRGKLFTAGGFGDECRILALDLKGKPLWQARNGKEWTGSYPGSRGTPTLYQGKVYHLSGQGRLACYDAEKGKEQWSRDILQEFGGKNIGWGVSESPLVTRGRVIVTPGGKDAALVALDADTGKTLWKTPGQDGETTSYCAAVPIKVGDRRVVTTMLSNSIVGVDFESGKLLWHVPHKTKYDVNCACPVFSDNHLFVSTGYGTGSVLLRLKPSGSGVEAKEVWRNPKLDNHHGGMLLVDGHLYGTGHNNNGGSWTCLEFRTGKEQYTDRGVGKGSATFADGMLYCLSEKGEMGLVKADPREHTVVSRFRIPKGGKGLVWAHPVVCGGRLYIRHGDVLYAYDIRRR